MFFTRSWKEIVKTLLKNQRKGVDGMVSIHNRLYYVEERLGMRPEQQEEIEDVRT